MKLPAVLRDLKISGEMPFVRRFYRGLMVLLLVYLCPYPLLADTAPKVVVEKLADPSGIAIQPETGHIFVAESRLGRILRIVDGQPQPVIVTGPDESVELGADARFRPLGLGFIDRHTLVIGTGNHPRHEAAVYVTQIPDVGADPLHLDSLLKLGPLHRTDESPELGDFISVVASKSMVYAAESDERTKGYIFGAEIKDLKQLDKLESFGQLRRFIATREAAKVPSPSGMTLSSRGEIVVGQTGALDDSRDSRLSFYRSTDGRLLLNLEIELLDVIAVQYGAPKPPSNKADLYVLDLANASPEMAGLYRLVAEFRSGKQAVRAVKIASLDRPTAMAIASDGSMYVTVLGPASTSTNANSGQVLRFEPGL